MVWRLNFSWSLVASGVSAVSQWLVIAFLARWFSSNALGQYTYALALVAPVVALGQLNLRLMQTVDQSREFSLGDFYAARTVGTIASAILLAVVVVLDPVVGSSVALILLVALSRFVEGVGDVAHGQFLQAERADLYAKSLVLRSVLQIAAVLGVSTISQDVVLVGVGLLVSALVPVVGFDLRKAAVLSGTAAFDLTLARIAGRVENCAKILRRAAPLGVMGVLGSLYQNIPRYEIGSRLGVEQVGHFSAVFYFTFIGYVVISAIGGSVSPKISRTYERARSEYRSLVLRVTLGATLVGVFGTVVAALWGAEVLSVAYGSGYGRFESLLVWIMLSSVLWYAATALSFCAIAAGRFNGQAVAHVIAVVLTWASAGSMIERYGLPGAAIALTIGLAGLLIAQIWIVYRIARDGYRD